LTLLRNCRDRFIDRSRARWRSRAPPQRPLPAERAEFGSATGPG
jgi:hypothetical protein